VIDMGRGNPDVGPPPHVVEALVAASREGTVAIHGYPPFAGLPAAKEAIAQRYATVYGVQLDPDREVALQPGTTTSLVELAVVLAERGERILLPDPGYPDYRSGVALAEAEHVPLPLDDEGRPEWENAPRDGVAAVFLNYPANPAAVAAPPGVFAEAVGFARETGAVVVHDFAYGDLVYDGRPPESFLAQDGAREVGVEMFSLSKTYGMAGWRLGFVVGNAEIVARLNTLQEHNRSGIFVPLQRAAIAALTGPQDSVEERRQVYARRRERVLAAIPGARCEGTFFVWFPLPEGLTFERLLTEHRVAIAPGEGFGSRGAGHARISLAVPDETLDEGLERLRQALAAG
jgi:aminotransferase